MDFFMDFLEIHCCQKYLVICSILEFHESKVRNWIKSLGENKMGPGSRGLQHGGDTSPPEMVL